MSKSELASMTPKDRKKHCAEYLADNTISQQQLKTAGWVMDLDSAQWMEPERAAKIASKRAKRIAKQAVELEIKRKAELEARQAAELAAKQAAELEMKRKAELDAKQAAEPETKPSAVAPAETIQPKPDMGLEKKKIIAKWRIIQGDRITHNLIDGVSTTDVKALHSMLVNKEWIVEAYYADDNGIMQSKYYALDEVTKELIRTDYSTWNCDYVDCKLCNVSSGIPAGHEDCGDGICKKCTASHDKCNHLCIAIHDTCNAEDCKKCNPIGHEQVYGRIPYIDIRGSAMKGIKVKYYTFRKAEDFVTAPQLEGIVYLRPY